MARGRNQRFEALLKEAGWSRAQAANALVRVAKESDLTDYTHTTRQTVQHWVEDHQPSGLSPMIMCEALSRRLGRVVIASEAGFAAPNSPAQGALDWRVDPLVALSDLGSIDLDPDRRTLLWGGVYSAAALAIPTESWWAEMAEAPHADAGAGAQRVSRGDVASVREMTLAFSRMDQRRGGGHGRTALVEYLRTDVNRYLAGCFPSDRVRREMNSAAEASYPGGLDGV